MNVEILMDILSGIGIGVIAITFFSIQKLIVESVKRKRKQKKTLKDLENKKCKIHNWDTLENTSYNKIGDKFCKDCGMIVTEDGRDVFINEDGRDAIALVRDNLKELAIYKANEKEKLIEKYSLSHDIVEDIYESGVNVKKNFHIKKIDTMFDNFNKEIEKEVMGESNER